MNLFGVIERITSLSYVEMGFYSQTWIKRVIRFWSMASQTLNIKNNVLSTYFGQLQNL